MTTSHSSINHPPTASAQYASFRSDPAEFPAFDRLRFLRLNDELLPAALRSANAPRLLHHPVLLYHSIPELIRDAHLDAMTKHRLILEYRREKRCVGRLIGWRTVTTTAATRATATNDDDAPIYFPDASVDLIRIPSLSDAEADGTLVEFYDSLPSFEETCASLESHADIHNGAATTLKEGDARELREYCLRWKNAVHCALNVLGMDLGGSVSPLSDRRVVCPTGTARIRDKRKALGDVSNRKKRKETPVEKAASVERRAEDEQDTKSKSKRETPQIPPHAPWAQVWKILRSHGWTWKGGSGLMTDYYYVKPDRRIKDGIERVDYFTGVEDVREFCRAEYGWIGEDRTECDSKKKNAGESNVDSGDDRDEDVPPLSTPLDPYTSWRSAWDSLLSSGWTWKAGSGLMTDYYYIKPDRKIKGGICGVDYFVRREDLEEYMKRNYGWIGEVERGLDCTEDEKTDAKRESSESNEGQKKKPKVAKSKVEKAKSKPAKSSTEEPQDDAFQKNKKPKVAKIKVDKPKSKPTKATTEELPASIVRETQPPARQEPKWKDLWAALKKEGWTVKTAGKYNPLHDWYYIRPGADPADPSAILGEHYFLEAQDVIDYCMIHRSDVVDAIEREKGRKEAAAAAAARAAAVAAEEAESAANREPTWKEVWTDLRKEGWKVESAGKYNKLHNWYYIRPGVNPSDENAFLGEHYFLELEDVMDFIKRKNNGSEDTKSCAGESNTREDSVSATSDEVSKSNAGSREVEETPVKPERVNTAAAKKALWKQLQSEGWTVEKASKWNILHDWYYIRPWVDPANPTAELGVDYFLCLDDVVNFVNNSSSVHDEESVVEHVTNDDAVSNEEPPKTVIDWKSLWIDLKKAGWDVVSAGKFNRLHDWYYLKPGVNPADEHSRLGEDYFLTPGDVIDFIEASGFKNDESKSIEDSDRAPVIDTPTQETSNTKPSNSKDPQTPLDCQTKPQDPAIPLPSSPESSTASDDDSYEWHNLWKRLKMAGWTYVKAGKYNKLHDGYYVRPGRDPGDENCELGKHYFMNQDDVIQFEKMREENEAKKKSERESMDVMQVIFEKEAEMQVEDI